MKKLMILALIALPMTAQAQNLGPCNTPECIARELAKLERDAARDDATAARRAAEDAAECARRAARGQRDPRCTVN